MKSIIHLLFFVFFVTIPASVLAQVELEDRNGDGEIRILAFGDSITFGVGDGISSDEFIEEAPILPGSLGYPGRVENLAGVIVDNRGEPGELLTEGGIARFLATLLGNSADYVFILEGTNDSVFRTSTDLYRAKLQAMINIARAVGVGPILLTLPPTCCDRAGQLPFLQAYSTVVRDIAATNNLTLVDIEVSFDVACPSISNCLLLNRPEGLHPNKEGYDQMGQVVAEVLLGESLDEEPDEETPTPTPFEEGS